MSTKKVGKIKIVYNDKEKKTADLVASACEKSLELAAEDWGLKAPNDCRIYVMTSWQGFILNSTPFRWKIMLFPTMPLWVPRIRRTWPYSAAWTQRYGTRIAIGIKPSRLIQKSDRKIGSIMTEEEKDPDRNIQNVICHELIHACSAHLILPMWLNEGIAILSSEHFAGKPIIRRETLHLIKDYTPKEGPPSYSALSKMETEDIAYQDSRGYWMTRYLDENHPDFLKEMLSMHRYEDEVEQMLAKVLGIEQKELWKKIDDIVTGYFLDTDS